MTKGTIRWTPKTATILAAAALATAAPLSAQPKPVVTAAPTSPTTVDVAWTAVPGSPQYRVQRGPGANGPWSAVSQWTLLLAHIDATVQPATAYAYRVQAKWPGGDTATSDPVAVTTPPTRPPSPPVVGGGKPVGGGLGAEQNPPELAVRPGDRIYMPTQALPNLTCEIVFGTKRIQFYWKNTGGGPASNFQIKRSITLQDPDKIIPWSSQAVGAVTYNEWYYTNILAEMTVDSGNTVVEQDETDNSCQKAYP